MGVTLDPGLRAALCRDPDDDTVRLVAADWLDDLGEPWGRCVGGRPAGIVLGHGDVLGWRCARECPLCGGSQVGPGRAAMWARFVRVQVALAAQRRGAVSASPENDRTQDALEAEEALLFAASGCGEGWQLLWPGERAGRPRPCRIARGRVPAWQPADVSPGYHRGFLGAVVVSPHAIGSGPGTFLDAVSFLARRHPVVSILPAECRPGRQGVAGATLYFWESSGDDSWGRPSDGATDWPLPLWLYERLHTPDTPYWYRHLRRRTMWYGTAAEALADLSQALLGAVREEAGLPPLSWATPRPKTPSPDLTSPVSGA